MLTIAIFNPIMLKSSSRNYHLDITFGDNFLNKVLLKV